MNTYETDEEERDAHAATYALHAHGVLFRHFAEALPDDDPWAEKVADVLCDAMQELEVLAREELEKRPGMLEAGRRWAADFAEQNREAREAFEATMERVDADEPA